MGAQGGEWSFVIPCLPPSVNALHNVIWSQRKVVLKPEVLKWRSDIALFVPRMELQSDSLVSVALTFHYNYWYANGKLRRFDTHNLVKVLLDVIAWKANFDDSRVKAGSWASVNDPNEKVEVVLRECVPIVTPPALASTGAGPTGAGTGLLNPATTDS